MVGYHISPQARDRILKPIASAAHKQATSVFLTFSRQLYVKTAVHSSQANTVLKVVMLEQCYPKSSPTWKIYWLVCAILGYLTHLLSIRPMPLYLLEKPVKFNRSWSSHLQTLSPSSTHFSLNGGRLLFTQIRNLAERQLRLLRHQCPESRFHSALLQ